MQYKELTTMLLTVIWPLLSIAVFLFKLYHKRINFNSLCYVKLSSENK